MVKTLALVLLTGAFGLWARFAPCSPWSCCSTDAPTSDVRGDYVEARNATVFAGACHYQSEYGTRGREAVLAWHLESGSFDGVSLAGLDIVAAVAGGANLDQAGARRSVVYVNESASDAQRDAALAWLRSEHAAALGEIAAVRSVPVSVELANDRFQVRAGDAVELTGSGLPDRACCTMPYEVWYAPFAAVERPLVGAVELVRCADPALGIEWSTTGENCAFFGEVAEGTRS